MAANTDHGKQSAMPSLDRDGTKVAYEMAGPDPLQASDQTRTVVLLHNIFCDRRVFTYATAVLQTNFRTIAVDFRGHGESPVPRRSYRVADLVADVAAILDQEKIARATLVGISLGATVAMEFALAHPDRVEGLVLMGADAAPDGGQSSLRNALFCRLVRLMGMRSFVLDGVANVLFGATFRREGGELYRVYRARLAALPGRAAAYAMKAWSGRRPLVEALPTVAVPTLVVVGDEDVSCPLPCGEQIVRVLPGATLLRIPGAGHTMTAERPRETSAALLGFLRAAV
jgi:pimeloyl-ACP methyl ester carboxylesterase